MILISIHFLFKNITLSLRVWYNNEVGGREDEKCSEN